MAHTYAQAINKRIIIKYFKEYWVLEEEDLLLELDDVQGCLLSQGPQSVT